MIYAAFLRAVNVGTHNRVRMEDVRSVVAGLGYDGVRTYLPTGNVALTSDDGPEVVAGRIEKALTSFGLRDVDVTVRTRDELAALDGAVFDAYSSEDFRHLATLTRHPVEIVESMPFVVRGVTVVGTGAALLAVIPREATRPLNANAVVEAVWKTRATTRWWNVVDSFRLDVLA